MTRASRTLATTLALAAIVLLLLPWGGCGARLPVEAVGTPRGVPTDASPPTGDGPSPTVVPACSSGGFCLDHPRLSPNRLNDVGGSGAHDVWAVGDKGVVLHYDGTAWLPVPSGTERNLRGVGASSPGATWIVGDKGTMVRAPGAGIPLTSVSVPTTADLFQVFAADDQDAWAVGAQGTVLHYDGATWTLLPWSDSFDLLAIGGAGRDDVWLIGVAGAYHFDGASWQKQGSSYAFYRPTGIWNDGSGGAFTLGGGGASDAVRLRGSETTTVFDGGPHTTLFDVWGTAANDIWLVGGAGFVTHFDGKVWTASGSPAGGSLFGVWGSSPTDVWAVGEAGTIVHFDGTDWSPSPAGRSWQWSAPLWGVWGSVDDDVWAVGAAMLHYDGAEWSASAARTGLRSVWGTSATDVWAVGGSTIMHFDGAHDDQTWNVNFVDEALGLNLSAVWAHSAARLWMVGGTSPGGAVLTRENGKWTRLQGGGGAGAGLTAVWGSTDDDVWTASWFSPVFGHYQAGRWITDDVGVFGQALWGTSATDIWGTSGNGVGVIHYDGTQWTFGATPATDRLQGIGGCSATDIWAVGERGTVIHYDGRDWSAVESGTTNDLRGVWCSPRGTVFVVGDGGAILRHAK